MLARVSLDPPAAPFSHSPTLDREPRPRNKTRRPCSETDAAHTAATHEARTLETQNARVRARRGCSVTYLEDLQGLGPDGAAAQTGDAVSGAIEPAARPCARTSSQVEATDGPQATAPWAADGGGYRQG